MQLKSEYAVCNECGHEFNNGESILFYDDYYYCNHDCLMDWIKNYVEEYYEVQIVEEYTNE